MIRNFLFWTATCLFAVCAVSSCESSDDDDGSTVSAAFSITVSDVTASAATVEFSTAQEGVTAYLVAGPVPVSEFEYAGRDAIDRLAFIQEHGETAEAPYLKTIGDLAACPTDMLESLMGKLGTQLHEYACGLDASPVRSRYDRETVKSVGNGTTFPQNLTTWEQVRGGIAVLADSVATRLRRYGLYAGGVQVTVRDPAFRDRSRQTQLSTPTHLIRDITAAALELTGQLWKPPSGIRSSERVIPQ